MKNILFFLGAVFLHLPIFAETISIDQADTVLPVTVDVPDYWTKNITVRSNGVIYSLKNQNAEIEIRSFVFNDVDMDYLINAKSARMYAKYSYINILLEKDEGNEKFRKQILFWKIRHQQRTYYEKTVIIQYQNNIVILSCLAPETDYPQHRVLFENAALSLQYDFEHPVKVKPDSSGANPRASELFQDISDEQKSKINKTDKIKKPDDVPSK